MRVVLTIPEDVVTVEVYVKSKNEAITYSRIFEGGSITNSRFIDKEETMGMRYTEGLEKRIDELEETFNKRIQKAHDRLNQFNERFAKVEGTFIECTDRLEKRIEALRRTVDSLDKWTDATDGQLKEVENRLAKLDKPCIDAEAFKSLPKSTGEVDATANRGVYTDILRRLKELEERAKVSRPTWDNFSFHVHRICKLESRMEDAERGSAIAESVRKQLAADIKAIQGRINKICEETCVDA